MTRTKFTKDQNSFYSELQSGWVGVSDTWEYSSTDGHNFVVTVPSDATATYPLGAKVKFTNNSTTFYGIIVKVTSTTLTIYGGTDYSVANSAITSIYYSLAKSPLGFVLDKTKWTEILSDANIRIKSSPTTSTWYLADAGMKLDVPIGSWDLSYQTNFGVDKTSTLLVGGSATLSTTNNSETDTAFTSACSQNTGTSANQEIHTTFSRSNVVTVTSKTTYYLLGRADSSATEFFFDGRSSAGTPIIIKAVCAYL